MKPPLGRNLCGQMMGRINECALLSKMYTNHCFPAVCITTLIKYGFAAHPACEVSGHYNVESLASYSRADAEG